MRKLKGVAKLSRWIANRVLDDQNVECICLVDGLQTPRCVDVESLFPEAIVFEAGELEVVMGPSSRQKTTKMRKANEIKIGLPPLEQADDNNAQYDRPNLE